MEQETSLPLFLQAIESGDFEAIERSLAPSVVLALRSQPGSNSKVTEINGRDRVMVYLREFVSELEQYEIRLLNRVGSRAGLEWGLTREDGIVHPMNRTMLVEFDGDTVSRLILMKDT